MKIVNVYYTTFQTRLPQSDSWTKKQLILNFMPNILSSVLQNCRRELLKILRRVMKKYWEMNSKKHCEVFLLKDALQKYWPVVCKNIEQYSAKILRGVLQKYREVFSKIAEGSPTLWLNEQHCKNSGSWSASCNIMAFFFRRQNDNSQILRVKSFVIQIFDTHWNMKKALQETGGAMIYGYEKQNGWRDYIE